MEPSPSTFGASIVRTALRSTKKARLVDWIEARLRDATYRRACHAAPFLPSPGRSPSQRTARESLQERKRTVTSAKSRNLAFTYRSAPLSPPPSIIGSSEARLAAVCLFSAAPRRKSSVGVAPLRESGRLQDRPLR